MLLFPSLLSSLQSFPIFNFWQWSVLLKRSLWGIQSQSVENKERGNFWAFKKPACSWPPWKATQQHQLGLKAGSTPTQDELYMPARLVKEKDAGPDSMVISPQVQNPLNSIKRHFYLDITPQELLSFCGMKIRPGFCLTGLLFSHF